MQMRIIQYNNLHNVMPYIYYYMDDHEIIMVKQCHIFLILKKYFYRPIALAK